MTRVIGAGMLLIGAATLVCGLSLELGVGTSALIVAAAIAATAWIVAGIYLVTDEQR